MKLHSLGEQLRAARIKKELSLYDVEKISGVEAQFLLAMEMDQLKALPEDIQQEALEKYATSVGLDGKRLFEEQIQNEQKLKKENSKLIAENARLEDELKNLDVKRVKLSYKLDSSSENYKNLEDEVKPYITMSIKNLEEKYKAEDKINPTKTELIDIQKKINEVGFFTETANISSKIIL